MHLDPSIDRGRLIAALMEHAERHNKPLSPSRAGRLATKVQRGDFTADDLTPVLQYADKTGEAAVNNVLMDAA